MAKAPEITRAVNRNNGRVFEGAELTPHLKLYIARNPDHFRIFYDEDQEDRDVAELMAKMKPATVPVDPEPEEPAETAEAPAPSGMSQFLTFSRNDLMCYSPNTLAGIAEERGLTFAPNTGKKALVDLILEHQDAH